MAAAFSAVESAATTRSVTGRRCCSGQSPERAARTTERPSVAESTVPGQTDVGAETGGGVGSAAGGGSEVTAAASDSSSKMESKDASPAPAEAGTGGAGLGVGRAPGAAAVPGTAITGRGRGVAAGGGGVGAGRTTTRAGCGVSTGPVLRVTAGACGDSRAAITRLAASRIGRASPRQATTALADAENLRDVAGVLRRKCRHHDQLGPGHTPQRSAEREPVAATVLVDEQARPVLAERRGEVRRVGDARGATETLGEEREQRVYELRGAGDDRVVGKQATSFAIIIRHVRRSTASPRAPRPWHNRVCAHLRTHPPLLLVKIVSG